MVHFKKSKDRRTAGPRNVTIPEKKAPDFSTMLVHLLKKHCQIHGGELTRFEEREKKGTFHIEHKNVSIIARMKEILHEEFGIPVETIGYVGEIQDNICMKLSDLSEESKLKVVNAFNHIDSIVVKKDDNSIKTTETMEQEKSSNESTMPVKKEYTGAKRGPKSKSEKRLLAFMQSKTSTEPSANVLKEPKVKKAPKTPKVKKEKLPKVLKVKNQPDVKNVKSDKEKLVEAYKFKVLSFITSVIKFEEGIKPFGPAKAVDDRLCYFNEISEGSYHYLICRNDSVRDVAYEALVYAMDYHNYPRTLHLVKDETAHNGFIGVNLRLMKHWKKADSVSYCLPPKIGASTQEVRMRIMKVSNIPPDIDKLGDLLLISYWNEEIAKETFSLVSEMGWNVSKQREKDFALDLRPISSEKKKIEPKVEETIPASAEPVVTQSPAKKPLTFDQKLFLLIGNNEEEAISDLDKIFFDQETFAKLSPQMVDKIATILRESYRNRRPEEYAEHLFKILDK